MAKATIDVTALVAGRPLSPIEEHPEVVEAMMKSLKIAKGRSKLYAQRARQVE